MLGNTFYNSCYSANMLDIRLRDLTVHNTVLFDIWWNMLIKFSKQLVNTFAKIIICYKAKLKTLSNIWAESFSAGLYWLQKRTQNLSKHLRWRFFSKTQKPFTIFPKFPNLDVSQGPEYPSELAAKVNDASFLNQFEYQR